MGYYIYCITNLINGKTYIGQHKYAQINDNYMGSGKYLWNAIRKYGMCNFIKDVIAVCPNKTIADILEIFYIQLYRSIGKAEYNICDGGKGTSGFQHTEEAKKIIGISAKANWEDPEYRAKMAKYYEDPMWRSKMGDGNRGRKQSQEEIQKRIESRRGYRHTEETKKKMSETHKKSPSMGMLGKHHTEENKQAMSKRFKGIKMSDEFRQHCRESTSRLWQDPAYRQRMSEAHKGKKQSPETIAKRIATIKAKKALKNMLEQ